MTLPEPSDEALAHSSRLTARIRQAIIEAGGWLPFARFMELALYAPAMGYYSAGASKFGAAGDFVTAPEMTPMFGAALASQAAQVMSASEPRILEVGAGSGRLAADLLRSLEERGSLPKSYGILDLSADLRERQRDTLAREVPHLLHRVKWLDALPERFSGLVVGNEVLDAMPAHLVVWHAHGIYEKGVALAGTEFVWEERPATGALLDAARDLAGQCFLPPGYESEIGLSAAAWTAAWAGILDRGAIILVDYGFPRREFYHLQRGRGTLMCHYRHYAHPDPLFLPGLQDITVHVDFTAIASSGHGAGLELLGYVNQAQFLLNCGILECLAALPADSPAYVRAAGAVNKLLMPHEMGELFKVIALGRGIDEPLVGFQRGDQSHRL